MKIDFISTCDCLISDTSTESLSPDESSDVLFSFDPKDETGIVPKFMIIRTTQPDLPKALFEVFGKVLGNTIETKGEVDTSRTGRDQPPRTKVVPLKNYYSAGCASCRKFLENTIPELKDTVGINIEVKELNILDKINLKFKKFDDWMKTV